MEQIKNFQITKCETNEDCPEYSNGCYIPEGNGTGLCNIYFICHNKENENCYILNEKEYINKSCIDNEELKFNLFGYNYLIENTQVFRYPYYKITNETQENMILTSCEKNNIINYKCKSDFCFRNNDCYSKKCYLGNCQTDNNYKSNICSLFAYQINNIDVNYTITCKYSKQEECNSSTQCTSEICDIKSMICVDENEEEQFQEIEKDEIFGIPSFIFVILMILLFIAMCLCLCRPKKQPTRLRLE
ncbi:hypothetical protein BCR32DRAFT_289126 [Anaeromyces robustus]|uniref:Uncharacterized protein n=1 Tax=Anaeromyces robustus TaxID=1754192 RepID=A0A1Y1XQ07_9FUNG|nr:hypothetical protein BCR32DRAFT_289126 [Anaeromyces robustus]|eukprot:ORX87822.1 hypothetical protein BCR32DRAFT_289126 [Anaeromyces robustus]